MRPVVSARQLVVHEGCARQKVHVSSRIRCYRLHGDPEEDVSDAPSPKAARQSLPRWLDPKLILGILFVAASMVLGAQVVSQADQTVEVWALQEAVPEGTELDPEEHLTTTRVRFTTEDDGQRYLSASASIDDGLRTTRALGSGELLPTDALTEEDDAQLRDFPIEASHVPSELAAGEVVDVYAVGTEAGGGSGDDQPGLPERDDADDGTSEDGDTSGDNGAAQVPEPSERVLTSVQVTAAGGDGGLGGGSGGVNLTVRINVAEESGEGRHTEDDITNAAMALSEGEAYIVRRSSS